MKVASCLVPNVCQVFVAISLDFCVFHNLQFTEEETELCEHKRPAVNHVSSLKQKLKLKRRFSFLVQSATSQVEGGLSPQQSGFLCLDTADCFEMLPVIELNFASIIISLGPDPASGESGIG